MADAARIDVSLASDPRGAVATVTTETSSIRSTVRCWRR
jgi:hypothetical protein